MNSETPIHHDGRPSEGASGAEKLFVVLVLLLSTGAFMNTGLAGSNGEPDVEVRALWYVAYLIMAALFFRKCTRRGRRLFAIAPLVGVSVFALASTLWSQDPALTFRHSLVLLLTLFFGVYFASRFNLREQLRLLAWTCGTCVVFSFVFGVFGLGTAVDAAQGVPGWYGIFVQKNSLGRVMVLSALVFLFWRRTEPEKQALARAGFLASLALIVLSLSMTSVVIFALVMGLMPCLRWALRKGVGWMVAGVTSLLASGIVVALYVITHLQQVAGLLGKDPTLSGRVQIWILSFVMALRRPWLGYGYEAFWLPDAWYVRRLWRVLGWDVPSAHNGFIELWLELGAIGTCLFLLAFAQYGVQALRLLRDDSGPAMGWPLAFLLFLFLMNLTEPTFLGSHSIFFVLFVAVAALMRGQSRGAQVAA